MTAVLAIHAGAGDHADELQDHDAECRAALQEALEAGRNALDQGQDALGAAQQAVMVMENFPLFNAGRGSVLCSDGSVEMSAAVMRGSDRMAGAVAGVKRTENPILAARTVLDSPQVLLVGPAADERAAQAGLAQRPTDYFITERQLARLDRPRAADRATVGAVCLDDKGLLAAATSTGGIRHQPPGRVGDCPVIGAGTWADAHAAVSCTGDGEVFIRCAVAREVAALVQSGRDLAQAAEQALAQVTDLRAGGGLIAVDPAGAVSMPFSTQIMPRGVWRAGSPPAVWTL